MRTDRVPGSAPPAAQLFAGAALLDAEKLDCYRLAVDFVVFWSTLFGAAGSAYLLLLSGACGLLTTGFPETLGLCVGLCY
jgi:hypothetical protein